MLIDTIRKILVVDFDGVLCQRGPAHMNPANIKVLNEIVSLYDPFVLVSSTHRNMTDTPRMKVLELLRKGGYTGNVHDTTPKWKECSDSYGVTQPGGMVVAVGRGKEIALWFDMEAKCHDRVAPDARILVLDDDVSSAWLKESPYVLQRPELRVVTVHPDQYVGLVDDHLENARYCFADA